MTNGRCPRVPRCHGSMMNPSVITPTSDWTCGGSCNPCNSLQEPGQRLLPGGAPEKTSVYCFSSRFCRVVLISAWPCSKLAGLPSTPSSLSSISGCSWAWKTEGGGGVSITIIVMVISITLITEECRRSFLDIPDICSDCAGYSQDYGGDCRSWNSQFAEHRKPAKRFVHFSVILLWELTMPQLAAAFGREFTPVV